MIGLNAWAWAQGCAMCRAALESSAEGKLVAGSFAHGILMMLVLPYALFGIFGFFIYRAYRKRQNNGSRIRIPIGPRNPRPRP